MARQINEEGLSLIKQWEGLVLFAYDDAENRNNKTPINMGDKVKGVLTIGYGHTSNAGTPVVAPGMRIGADEAERILRKDLRIAEAAVSRLVKVELTDNQFSALVSLVFNIGETAFKDSTLLKELNKKNYTEAQSQFGKWVYDNKKKVQGLVNRRAQEAALFGKGKFVSSNTVPAAPKTPEVFTKDNVTWGAGIAASMSGMFYGDGPFQWALAAMAVVAFTAGAILFIRKRWKVG